VEDPVRRVELTPGKSQSIGSLVPFDYHEEYDRTALHPKGEIGLRFTVLASGSSSNASSIESAGFGVLLDVGLGPRQLAERLQRAGLSWSSVQAVLLTHTHSDHWKDATLVHLHRHRIPLWCHVGHHTVLRTYSDGFLALEAAGLVRCFAPFEAFDLSPALRCQALPVRHDSGATFGFRLEGGADLFGRRGAIGYVSDLGCWDKDLAAQLVDVDLLAVEFNHDVALERSSKRGPHLIQRVLGDEGHLSNEQAVELVRAVLQLSTEGRLRHLVQLHLSRECNRPALARAAAQQLFDELRLPVAVHTARQDEPGATIHLSEPVRPRAAARSPRRRSRAKPMQPLLPGLDD
jgi:phosphoribosyl 1,2-cyclic phosphodiesterase